MSSTPPDDLPGAHPDVERLFEILTSGPTVTELAASGTPRRCSGRPARPRSRPRLVASLAAAYASALPAPPRHAAHAMLGHPGDVAITPLGLGAAVEAEHQVVVPADDQEGRHGHGGKPRPGEIGTAAARHHRRDVHSGLGGSPQCRRRAGAGTKVADGRVLRARCARSHLFT